MSTINVNRMVDSQGGVLSPISSVMRNRIINGDMRIDQRNTGASVTPASGAYTLDRWTVGATQTSKFSVQQNAGSVTPPAGFTNYLGVTSLAATSVGASDFFFVQQIIEGFNIADLGYGSANAQTVTLSFWTRSSLTGTFGGVLYGASGTRSYAFTYTINSANTWEQKSITIAGVTSGTWLTTNGAGLQIIFSLGAGSSVSGTAGSWQNTGNVSATGSTSVVGTNGATFYITGVQLEKGSNATGFEYRQYGHELALCQRYFQKTFGIAGDYLNYGVGIVVSGTVGGRVCFPLYVPMRVGPTLDILGTSLFDAGAAPAVTATGTVRSTPTAYSIDLTAGGGGLTVGRPAQFLLNPGATNYISLSSEL